ncbi:hypothetical protein SAMN05216383_105119 [Prevotella sp. KH2C16]|nr:hypothetical protein SAMN05216383_105119 [Prevotella sp. KH2C16]
MRVFIIIAVLMLFPVFSSAQSEYNALDSLGKARKALALHPDSLDLRLQKAAWNLELQQWNEAKNEYDYVLNISPKNVAGLYYRAYVNEKLHRYSFARLDYESLLTLIPRNFEAQLGLALLNQKDLHYTEAYDQINNLIQQYPDSAIAYAARGGMEKERGMLDLAAFDYSEAIKRDHANLDYRLSYIDLLITLGREEEAREELSLLDKLGVARMNLIDFYKRLRKK